MHCLICCEASDTNDTKLDCSCLYWYHDQCIHQWLNISNKCPICKKIFSSDSSHDEIHLIVQQLLDDVIEDVLTRISS